jgi:hypothetical protein
MFGGYISVDFVQWKRSNRYKVNHGCFASDGEETNWAYEEIEQRTKLADKMKTPESHQSDVKRTILH